MEIKAVIIDDEPLAQNVIKQYALKLPDLKIVATCNDAICAHRILQEHAIDLIFLDINMPKLSGISFLRSIKTPPLVVFTTAYSEYALEGFELNAIDYLKKPFSFDRFCKAYFKAEEMLQLKLAANATASHVQQVESDHLYVKSNKKAYKIAFSEIHYVEGLGDYIQIHLNDQKIVTNISMKKILELLPSSQFYRIHKSFIISLNKINLIEGNMVKIKNVKIPIGNSFRQDFMQYINKNLAE